LDTFSSTGVDGTGTGFAVVDVVDENFVFPPCFRPKILRENRNIFFLEE
jgi:hypothetical protein